MSVSGEQMMFLDRRDMAARLGISERHLGELTRRGSVPVIRLGRRVKYDPDDVRNALRSQSSQTEEG